MGSGPRGPARGMAHRLAALALGLQGIAGAYAGARFLANAGQFANPTMAGFAGLLGLALLVPALAALAAAAGLLTGHPRAQAGGRVLGMIGAVLALAFALVLGSVGSYGAALLALAIVAANVGIVVALRDEPRRAVR